MTRWAHPQTGYTLSFRFYCVAQISSIQESIRLFNDNITRIAELHARALNNTNDAAAARNAQQLEELVNETSALSTTLKRRVQALERQGGSGREAQIRRQQVSVVLSDTRATLFCDLHADHGHQQTALVKSKFVEAIQNYQQVEQQYRQKYKQRMERQFKIGEFSLTRLVVVHLREPLHFQSSLTRRRRRFVLSSRMIKAGKSSLKLWVLSPLFVTCPEYFISL
jgi:t-SNARE complex subunit (syntaxin)